MHNDNTGKKGTKKSSSSNEANQPGASEGSADRTSRAARRQAMRDNKTPTSRTTTSQTGNEGTRQTTVEGADGTSTNVQTQHPADKSHSNPHWHDANPKIDPATGKEIKNRHGQIKEKSDGRSTSEYDG